MEKPENAELAEPASQPTDAATSSTSSADDAVVESTERARVARGAALGAIVIGGLGSLLFRPGLLGINAVLWVGALALVVFAVARRADVRLAGGGRWLLPTAVLGAGALAWRDSSTLAAINALAVAVALGIAASYSRGGRLAAAGIVDQIVALAVAAGHATFSALLVAGDFRWPRTRNPQRARTAAAVARGVVIALPLVLVFGALFVAADARFATLVASLLWIDLRTVFEFVLIAVLIAWPVAGALRQILTFEQPIRLVGARPAGLALGIIELGIVLGALDLLFAAFVVVQLPYLFGGSALVVSSPTLTFSDYARRGFFELIGVGALVLPLLLWADWSLRRERARDERLFRVAAALLVGLVFVVLASALHRMLVYVAEFGLTELRLYPTAFMGWLAVVFVLFGATVLRGRRERFAISALVAGLVLVIGLNVVNPDDLIARTNVARGRAGLSVDAAYLARLSADAAPALVAGLPALAEPERDAIVEGLRRRLSADVVADWRTWNLGRSRALAILGALD